MSEAAPDEFVWRFEVYLTRRHLYGGDASVESYVVPLTGIGSRTPARTLADAILNGVLKQTKETQSDLFTQGPANDWLLRFAASGAVDEMTLGVQATYLDPARAVVGMLAMHFPPPDD